MTISRDEMRDLKGTKIRIDGVSHVVAKAVMRSGIITTEDGIEVNAENAEKKGKIWHFPAPKKSRGKKDQEAPAETARQRRAREKKEREEAEDAPVETARQRRAREKKEREEAEQKPKSTRGRNRNKSDDDEKPTNKRVPRDSKPAAKGDGATRPEGKKKKIVEAFDQAIAEAIGQEVFDLLSREYALHGRYAVMPVAVGGDYSEQGVKVSLTLLPTSLSAKEIKAYIRDHREATDISPEDEEDDDLEDLEDDDNEDLEDSEGLADEIAKLFEDVDLGDVKKIARKLGLTSKKSWDIDAAIAAMIEEVEDLDTDQVREAAEALDIELSGDEEEEEDGEEEEEDDGVDDEEDEDDEEEEEDDKLTVEDMVNAVLEAAPDMKPRMVKKFVEAYLSNEEVESALGDDLAPGFSQLQEKGGEGPTFLLVGYDAEKEQIKLLNLDTLKTRSKDLLDIVHMDILEDEE